MEEKTRNMLWLFKKRLFVVVVFFFFFFTSRHPSVFLLQDKAGENSQALKCDAHAGCYFVAL